MAKTRTQLVRTIERYVRELERLGIPVERIVLYGSHCRREAGPDSDIDLAVFSDVFGPPDYREFSGMLSEAKWNTEPMIEAVGFHPSALDNVDPISFLNEIASTGEIVYRRRARRNSKPPRTPGGARRSG